jgi:hypothetical protein
VTPGIYQAVATVTDADGKTSRASASVTVRAVAGSWYHAAYHSASQRVETGRLTLTQSGRTVSGELSGPGVPGAAVTGTIDGERTLRLTAAGVTIEGTIPGEVFADGAILSLGGFPRRVDQPVAFTPITGAPSGPAPTAKLDIRVDSVGSSTAIQGFTPVRFSAADSSGDSLRYILEFGDGQFTTESTATHACGVADYGVESRATVIDRFGRIDSRTNRFRCVNLARYPYSTYWSSIRNPITNRIELRWLRIDSQVGAALNGRYTHPEGTVSRFYGVLSAERDIRLTLEGGGIELLGQISLSDSPPIRARMKGGSADGMTLNFQFDFLH